MADEDGFGELKGTRPQERDEYTGINPPRETTTTTDPEEYFDGELQGASTDATKPRNDKKYNQWRELASQTLTTTRNDYDSHVRVDINTEAYKQMAIWECETIGKQTLNEKTVERVVETAVSALYDEVYENIPDNSITNLEDFDETLIELTTIPGRTGRNWGVEHMENLDTYKISFYNVIKDTISEKGEDWSNFRFEGRSTP